ncbi:hypothetical protein [Oenococcus sp.]|uniref:hypothetical protein n=1 Tax=Oenococcus sp. TaxID=1979414 RepID=UPI0039EB6D88
MENSVLKLQALSSKGLAEPEGNVSIVGGDGSSSGGGSGGSSSSSSVFSNVRSLFSINC